MAPSPLPPRTVLLSYRTRPDGKDDVSNCQCGSPIKLGQNPASETDMIKRDSHLLKGWEVQLIGCTAWIDEDLLYIKTVNTDSKYKCILMRGNDSGRVNKGKGYRAVNRLNCCDVLSGIDGVHPGSDRGRQEHFSPLLFGLILSIGRSPPV